jgi:importin subunit beta-1
MLGHPDHTVIKAAATCVAAIAVIEVPSQQWPEIIPLLSENALSTDINVRLASLQTLGFICEDINPESLAPDNMNQIFFAVLSNVIPEQPELTNIAMKAFARAAPITDKNFMVPEQKHFIMEKLFEASKINHEEILQSIMEALNEIVRVNYDYMFEFIESIGNLTMTLINSEHDKAAQLAIEVWTTISEVEMQRKAQGRDQQGIIMSCYPSILQIIITGL